MRNYLLDGLYVVCEFSDSGDVLREYVPGVCFVSGGSVYYYHYDRLGSVRFMSDEGGNVVSEYVYDAWGNLVSSSGSVSQPYEYVGREGYYREGELYLLGQRWYDSSAGRFISRDPIGEEGGVNLYVYVGNNPLNYTDPIGNFCIWAGSSTKFEWIRVSPINIKEGWVKVDEIDFEDVGKCECIWEKWRYKSWQEILWCKKEIQWVCYDKCKGWYTQITSKEWIEDRREVMDKLELISQDKRITWGLLLNPHSIQPICLCSTPY